MANEDELRRLQRLHEKALRSAQRQEHTRRMRLHFQEVNLTEREQLSHKLDQKLQQVESASARLKGNLQRRMAAKNRAVHRRTQKVQLKREVQLEVQRQAVEEARMVKAKKAAAAARKRADYATMRRSANNKALQRAHTKREQHCKAKDHQAKMIGERLNERLSKTRATQQAFLQSVKRNKGKKNRQWQRRVETTRNKPDMRKESLKERIKIKYEKIERQKQTAQTLDRHRKMLQDKLLRQRHQWALEYDSRKALNRPTQAQVSPQARIRVKDLVNPKNLSPTGNGNGSSAGSAGSPNGSGPGTPTPTPTRRSRNNAYRARPASAGM